MEINLLIKLIKKFNKITTFSMIIGALLGLVIYLLPDSYLASGSIYVGRVADKNTGFFTYEGYYSQQTAIAYSNSVLALLQSTDLVKDTLVFLEKPVNDYNLWQLKKDIVVKKAGPQTQVINITTKGTSQADAIKTWNIVYSNLDKYTSQINTQSDPALQIYKISEVPVIKKEFKSLPLFVLFGVVSGFCFALTVILGKYYLKEDK